MAFFPAVGENTSSVPLLKNLQKLSFFGCQWQLMCRQEWQMIIRLRSLKNQSSYIYKSFSTEHSEHHIITSTHSKIFLTGAWLRFSSTHAYHRARAIFSPCGGALPPTPSSHIYGESLLFQLRPFAVVWCSCSCTFSIDCSENASAELGSNARYQATPCSLWSLATVQ